jgi:hypothetical protein
MFYQAHIAAGQAVTSADVQSDAATLRALIRELIAARRQRREASRVVVTEAAAAPCA